MSINISGFGTSILIVSVPTFTAGFTVTQFSDDGDPIDFPSQTIRNTGMGANGHLVSWSSPSPIMLTLNVIADTIDDENLSILAKNNQAVRGRRPISDVVTATVVYADGRTVLLANGCIAEATLITGMSTDTKKKTKTYTFAFESAS